MIEKVDSAVLPNNYIAFEDLDSDFFAFFSRYIGLNSIDLNNINLDYDHSDYCDPETINYVKIMTWHKHIKIAPKKKIYEKLLPVAWHPTRWWDWCVPENVKKKTTEIGNMFL